MRARGFLAIPVTLGIVVTTMVMAVGVSVSSAAAPLPAPGWSIQALAAPTNFFPGDESGLDNYAVFLTNSGGDVTDKSKITIVDTLPDGLGVKSVELRTSRQSSKDFGPSACKPTTSGEVSTVTCTIEEGVLPEAEEPATLNPSEALLMIIHVNVPSSPFSGPLANQVTVKGGGAEEASGTSHNQAIEHQGNPVEAVAGFQEFRAALTGPNGKPTTGADSHPYQDTTSFAVNLNPSTPGSELLFAPAQGDLKEIEVALPPGLIGNPTSVATCTAQQFNTIHGGSGAENECPDGSAVGLVTVQQLEGGGAVGGAVPLYNLLPPPGMPVQLGFQPALGLPVYIDTKLRSDGDYGITAYLADITEAKRVTAARVTIWGTPAESSHDRLRGHCAQAGGNCPADLTPIRPFLRLPSSCALALTSTMRFDTWPDSGAFLQSTETEPAPTGCDLPGFSPSIEAKPTTGVADAPSGLHVNIHLPQKANEDPEGLGEADLRDATVTLPEGLLPNPSLADGLAACSEAQVGYEGVKEARQSFSAEPANCPDASKIGTVELDTSLLDRPIRGAVYLAKQGENPFNSLLAIYVTVDDPQSGVVVKLPGQVEPNPLTGQLTTTVQESPQLSIEDFHLDFFEGARAALRTPATCGEFATTTSLTPWTAPASGAAATPSGWFEITSGPGGACPNPPPFAPSFAAGTTSNQAGGFSPFSVTVSRRDSEQDISGLALTTPPGLLANLSSVPPCPEPQAQHATCAEASRVGSATIAAGAGPTPLWLPASGQPSDPIYLTGPYHGAPFGLSIVVPAVAGPFNLGSIILRTRINVNPQTGQLQITTDPIPQILQGIPLDVRTVNMTIERPGFILNPTNCNPLSVSATLKSAQGAIAAVASHFQAANCRSLKFSPKVTALTYGNGEFTGHGASLHLKITTAQGQANMRSLKLDLPQRLPARLETIQQACPQRVFKLNPAACPRASVIGSATVATPLLDEAMRGPAILVSHGGAAFPDMVLVLQAQGVRIDLTGALFVDQKNVTSTTFRTIPDVPIRRLDLVLPEGKRSALAASASLCSGSLHMSTAITGQNGARVKPMVKVAVAGCRHKKKRQRHPTHRKPRRNKKK